MDFVDSGGSTIAKKRLGRWVSPLLAFALALLLVFLIFSQAGFGFANGDGLTILISDSQTQYIAYFRLYRRILLGDDDAFYTLCKALGGNTMSLFTYYLASPFNLLVLLWPASELPVALIWIETLKISTASLNMALYLNHSVHSQKGGLANMAFALAYALCSFTLVYIWSPMWLDGVLVLPLIVWGIERIKNHQGLWLYPIALSYALLTSWYIGFMICIFVFLYGIYLIGAQPEAEKKDNHHSSYYTIRYLLTLTVLSLLGILIASPFLLATFTKFSGTKASFGFPDISTPFYDLWNLFRNMVTGTFRDFYTEVGTYSDTTNGDVFVGIFVGGPAIVFFCLYFFASSIPLRERLSRLTLFLVFLLILSSPILDTFMHGGRVPTWFPVRYAFLIAFLLAKTGADGYGEGKTLPWYSYFVPLSALALGLTSAYVFLNGKGLSFEPSIGGLISYALTFGVAIIRGSKSIQRKIFAIFKVKSNSQSFEYALGLVSSVFLIAMSGVSLYGEGSKLASSLAATDPPTVSAIAKSEDFQKDVDYVEDVANGDNEYYPAYRMENTYIAMDSKNDIDNDATYYGFNGLGQFSSVEKEDVMAFIGKAGYHYNGFWEDFGYGSTIAMDSLFGVRYIIANGSNLGLNYLPYLDYQGLLPQNGTYYYENQYVLPIAFTAPTLSSIVTIADYYEQDGTDYALDQFQWQNQLYRELAPDLTDDDGTQLAIFKPLNFYYIGTDESGYVESGGTQGILTTIGSVTRTAVTTLPYGSSSVKVMTFDVAADSELRFAFDIANDEPVYWYFKDLAVDTNSDSVSYYMDGIKISNYNYWHNGISSFTNGERDHVLTIKFLKEFKGLKVRDGIYVENLANLKSFVSAILNRGPITSLNEINPSLFKGTFIKSDESAASLLFTIPYENGMNIFVDGKRLKTTTALDIFTAADISDISLGSHTFSLYYVDQGFLLGTILSTLAFAITGLFVSCNIKRRQGSGDGYLSLVKPDFWIRLRIR